MRQGINSLTRLAHARIVPSEPYMSFSSKVATEWGHTVMSTRSSRTTICCVSAP
ncbi:uncharacterized protein PHALS_10925 [Plasmopara halstedii]|uniref:Uncharacterized protein n=1 Tax=Plasmopara halstedii TaxID=4781 RepID=A0A0P1AIB1_PLAHL|nr:uncharacterized protein PHALS_10925 [Plasmopara halstedii]CEG40741.1 hypothetical protein PHALS_10925 [Plasmopara halstedii]|eukprot:XP_024577110.1 hypothetical protein PHALS_10925 [Plasmopara halstedii]